MRTDRNQEAYNIRVEAAELAKNRTKPHHEANGDEERYAQAHYAMSFTKGLDHCDETGLVKNPNHFQAFRKAINEGWIDPFTGNVPVPHCCTEEEGGELTVECTCRRQWEAPTAGIVYDLEGPDAQAVTMPPAPALGSAELAYEMAEVYELAILRDTLFSEFMKDGAGNKVDQAIARLDALPYAQEGYQGRPRKTNATGGLSRQTVFRGSSPGVENGPYISQFLWIGNEDQTKCNKVCDGKITYGALQIDQRVPIATEERNYMEGFGEWRHVQQGCTVNPDGQFQAVKKKIGKTSTEVKRRFIITPRDMATYVHFDALYEAYLNACLILLDMKTPFDPGFGHLSGQGHYMHAEGAGSHTAAARNTGGFALFGGPHILTLVTEVATRALKAVRYQKFNNHLRLRPEALAARIEKAGDIERRMPFIKPKFSKLAEAITQTVTAIKGYNKKGSALLPMAYPEGSPMHPSYGAGHATVAGACVTILKAYFDTSAILMERTEQGKDGEETKIGFFGAHDPCKKHVCDRYVYFEPVVVQCEDGRMTEHKLKMVGVCHEDDGKKEKDSKKGKQKKKDKECIEGTPLTLEGELNKLAANISIGRNMAGVHYFSDYYDSLRMGEEIAIGILEEQALCYPTDKFVMTVPTFDGEIRRIGRR